MTIKEWAEEIHGLAAKKGWWPEGKPEAQTIAEVCANIHGEVSELWEAWRLGMWDEPCDKRGLDLTAAEEEMADIIIRTLDAAEGVGINIERAIRLKHRYNQGRAFRHGGKLA